MATNDESVYKEALKISDIVSVNKTERLQKINKISYKPSYSFRPSELNFIWGYLQLNRLNDLIKMRQQIAKEYIDKLDHKKYLIPKFDLKNIYFRFIVGTKQNDIEKFLKYMLKKGIEVGRGVYPPISAYGFGRYNFRNANIASQRSISIPLYPSLSDKEIDYIIDSFNNYAE